MPNWPIRANTRSSSTTSQAAYSALRRPLPLAGRPTLTNARVLTNGLFSLTVTGPAGSVYAIEGSPQLSAWIEIGTVSNATGQVEFVDPASGTNTFQFYRARVKYALRAVLCAQED